MIQFSNLGDIILNFICSAALTKKINEPIGIKVSNKILSNALIKSKLLNFLKRRKSIHERGDIIEALFGYLWFHNMLSLDICVKFITDNLPKNFKLAHVEANEELARSIAKLVDYLIEFLNLEINLNNS